MRGLKQMAIVAIIQARMGSTRLPGKVLAELGGRPVLEWVVRAAQAIPGVDRVVIATSATTGDDLIANFGAANGVTVHRGSECDVLSRFAQAAEAEAADIIIRLTADCPLLDPHVCGQVLALLTRTGAAYASNCDPPSWPDGLDCEAFTIEALRIAAAMATRCSDREHVTPFIRNNRHRFLVRSLICPLPDLQQQRWTLDTEEDLAFLRTTVGLLPTNRPPSHLEVLAALDTLSKAISDENHSFPALPARQSRNQGSGSAQITEPMPLSREFTTSQALLQRALAVIPLGSQTFSKSHIQYPAGAAPLFLSHGDGGRVWDVDGNEYVDLVNGLLPVVLGYRDPDVDQAVREQLTCGISFSLATRLEADLAERLVEIIPCAEQVRYGKNGADATSAAIRLARAFTGRDRIAVCGYHGWHDWYIGTTSRNKGVPDAVRELSHVIPYNDLDAIRCLLRERPGEVAALIMEPMNLVVPAPGYLNELKDLLHRHGALLIFDEIITGFRYALGGAQALFGVTPDLATFGKAMANGMPLSAVVGRAEVMAETIEIFFSATFGGETLSLAAAIAVIDKMRREPVIERLWQSGGRLVEAARGAIASHNLENVLEMSGQPPWMLLSVNDHKAAGKGAIKTFFIKEMIRQGVLTIGSHNVSYAHSEADLAKAVAAWHATAGALAEALASGDFAHALGLAPIVPLFQVR